MPFRVACPRCQSPYTCPDEFRGKKLACKKCQLVFQAGQPPAPPPSAVRPVPAAGQAARPVDIQARRPAPPPPAPVRAPARPPMPRVQPLRKQAVSPVLIVAGVVAVLAVGGAGAWWLWPRSAESVASQDGQDDRQDQKDAKGSGGGGMDVSYIASSFNAAVIVHPRRMLKSPVLSGLPLDQLIAPVLKASGIDPRQIEQAIALVDPMPGGNVLFLPGGIIRFAGPVDGKKLLSQGLKGAQEATFKGKTYYRGNEAMAGTKVCGYVPDDRTVVLGPEPTLQKMLSAQEAKSPLIDRLRKVDLDNDVIAVFVMAPVRPVAQELMKQAKSSLPPMFAEAATLPERLQSATVALNLSGDTLLKVDLEADSEESAGVLLNLTSAGHKQLKDLYPVFRKQLEGQAPPPVAGPIFAVLDDAVAGLGVKKDAGHVVVSLKAPKGLAELPAKLMPLVGQLMAAGPPMPPPPPPRKNIRDQAVDWVKVNNRFGPHHKIVDDTRKRLMQVGFDEGFVMKLGGGLVQSSMPTVLVGWDGELFVWPLTPAQAKAMKVPEHAVVTTNIRSAGDLGPAPPAAVLAAPRIDHANDLEPGQKITGAVTFRQLGSPRGHFALRVMYLTTGSRYIAYQQLEDMLPGNQGMLTFTFTPDRDGFKAGDLVVAVMELISYVDGERRGKAFVVSNPVATLVRFK
ncbi:MAG TPA: hypothetical protein VG013_16095 [Gemmataceae bacterium]|nr:hypothetical protein [Gemmataceae bacterium]